MALLAEEIVEEWLNRQGYFTIRGVKVGVDEIDILATRFFNKAAECRQFEVQCSVQPISYISKLPKRIQKETGRAANTMKRSESELKEGVKEWIEKKYTLKNKVDLIKKLCPFEWSKELVIHKVHSEEEVKLIEKYGIRLHRLSEIVSELKKGGYMISSASGGDLIDLIHLSEKQVKF